MSAIRLKEEEAQDRDRATRSMRATGRLGAGAGVAQQAEMTAIPFGTGEIRRESTRTYRGGKTA